MTEADFKNILIVRTDRIGDVVLTTPAIKALRVKFPNARISILVQPYTRDLIEGNDFIDQVILDDRDDKHAGLFGFFRLVRKLKNEHFDCAIILHTKKRTNLACFLARIPCRLGYKNEKFGKLLTHPIEDKRHFGEKHEAQYCLDVLKGLGVNSAEIDLRIPLQPEAESWVEKFLTEHTISTDDKLVIVHPGASDPSKCWPVHYFIEVIEQMIQKYACKLAIIGAPNMESIGVEMTKKLRGSIIDLTGKTTVGQMASLLNRSNLLVSNDSGPVHIAAALDKPVISIFTRNQPGINPERWQPLGKNSRAISIPPNEDLSFQKAGKVDREYLELIKPQAVLEEVDGLFKLC